MSAALGIGVAAGVGFGWFAWWLTRLVRDGTSDATLTTDDAVGREGKVVSSIPADGYGTVRILVGGHVGAAQRPGRRRLLEAGTAVHVTEVLSPTAVDGGADLARAPAACHLTRSTRPSSSPGAVPMSPPLSPSAGSSSSCVLLVLLVTSRYKVAGPNQAFIVTGRKGKAVLNPETGP